MFCSKASFEDNDVYAKLFGNGVTPMGFEAFIAFEPNPKYTADSVKVRTTIQVEIITRTLHVVS